MQLTATSGWRFCVRTYRKTMNNEIITIIAIAIAVGIAKRKLSFLVDLLL